MPTLEGCEDSWKQVSIWASIWLKTSTHAFGHHAADCGFHNHVLPYPIFVEDLLCAAMFAFIQNFNSLSTVLIELFFYLQRKEATLFMGRKQNKTFPDAKLF